jgi:hypothetical protein
VCWNERTLPDPILSASFSLLRSRNAVVSLRFFFFSLLSVCESVCARVGVDRCSALFSPPLLLCEAHTICSCFLCVLKSHFEDGVAQTKRVKHQKKPVSDLILFWGSFLSFFCSSTVLHSRVRFLEAREKARFAVALFFFSPPSFAPCSTVSFYKAAAL